MVRNPWSIAVLGLALLVFVCCDSTPKKPEAGQPPATDERTEKDGGEDETVIVPRLCVEQMKEFFEREQLLLADRIVIDASADPFHGAIAFVADPQAVEKIEAVDAVNKISIYRYRNKTGQMAMESVMPKIRVAGGFLVVATREIVVRLHKPVRPERPIFFDLVAAGEVVYSDSHRSQPLRKDKFSLELEVREEGSGYMFASHME